MQIRIGSLQPCRLSDMESPPSFSHQTESLDPKDQAYRKVKQDTVVVERFVN